MWILNKNWSIGANQIKSTDLSSNESKVISFFRFTITKRFICIGFKMKGLYLSTTKLTWRDIKSTVLEWLFLKISLGKRRSKLRLDMTWLLRETKVSKRRSWMGSFWSFYCLLLEEYFNKFKFNLIKNQRHFYQSVLTKITRTKECNFLYYFKCL